MSDEQTQGTPAQAPSSGEPTIPKSRLDEEIAKRKQLEQQTQWYQNMLSQQQRGAPQQQQPQQEPEWLVEMRENNPSGYKAFIKQQRRLSGLENMSAALLDNQDRIHFEMNYGKAGKKRIDEIEQVLQQERSRGNVGYTREQIYQWMLGRERAVEAERQEATPPVPVPQAPQAPLPSEEGVPPSNPQSATSVTGATGSVRRGEKTREERFAELENVEF